MVGPKGGIATCPPYIRHWLFIWERISASDDDVIAVLLVYGLHLAKPEPNPNPTRNSGLVAFQTRNPGLAKSSGFAVPSSRAD